MNYEDLFLEYISKLEYVKRMLKLPTCDSEKESFLKGYRQAAFSMFQSLRMYFLNDLPKIEKLSDEEEAAFPKIGDGLAGVFRYRNENIPVYIDDPGQQLYIIFRGHEICGGAYNSDPAPDFAYRIDEILDLDEK